MSNKDNKKIATLWDNKDSDDANEHDHRDGQAFYAGGSEHSGQQILGPSRDGPEFSSGFIENLFNQARRSAALVQDQDDSTSPGNTTVPIIFWRNGFTVGQDGELRDFASDNNRQFLDYLRRGETPPELDSRVRGGSIDVKLEKRPNEDYKPKRKLQAFTGEGHRLGAPTPETIDDQQSSSAKTASSSDAGTICLKLDDSKPATTIQVRLVDNSRLVVRINLTHSVGDLVSHIRSVRPQYSSTNFVLATTFPAKELTDLEQTIGDAKLANASVLQKIKRQ